MNYLFKNNLYLTGIKAINYTKKRILIFKFLHLNRNIICVLEGFYSEHKNNQYILLSIDQAGLTGSFIHSHDRCCEPFVQSTIRIKINKTCSLSIGQDHKQGI